MAMVTRYDVIYVISSPFYSNTHHADAFLINSNAKKCIRVAFDCFLFGILTLSVRLLLFFFVFNSHFLRKRKLTIFHKNSTKTLE